MVRMLLAGSRGTVLVEFAILGPVLLLVTLGAMYLGLILWAQGALQAVAADAARCGAIKGTACTGSNSVQSYIQTDAATWGVSEVTGESTININSAVNTATCPAISPGTYETVQITTSYFSGWFPSLLPQFANYTIDVCASYAM